MGYSAISLFFTDIFFFILLFYRFLNIDFKKVKVITILYNFRRLEKQLNLFNFKNSNNHIIIKYVVLTKYFTKYFTKYIDQIDLKQYSIFNKEAIDSDIINTIGCNYNNYF